MVAVRSGTIAAAVRCLPIDFAIGESLLQEFDLIVTDGRAIEGQRLQICEPSERGQVADGRAG